MAENIYYSELDIIRLERETSEEDEEIYKQKQTEERSVVERERKSVICESCVRKRLYEGMGWCERVAVFLCFACEIYVCVNCLPEHKSHKGMKVWRKESERENERETSESDRMGEQGLSRRTKNKGKGLRNRMEAGIEREEGETSESERLEEDCDRKISLLLDDLMAESETERIEKFENSHVSIIDRVEVKHELDQKDCWITGLCGLENKRLVVCDYLNSCIKIFKLGSHVLQRYIRFVGYRPGPRDVTEIDLKQNYTEPKLVSGSSSDISATDRADPDKQCLIAVTLPSERQIMFIDLSKKPAKAQKLILTVKKCYSIQFDNDMIFTLCSGRFDSPSSVYVYSTDGDKLYMFTIYDYLAYPYYSKNPRQTIVKYREFRYRQYYDDKIITECTEGLDRPSSLYIRRRDGDTVNISLFGVFSGPRLDVVSGRVYITNDRNSKVECRNIEGLLISEITIEGSRPAGISVDSCNNVYVCQREYNKVYKLNADLTRYKSVLDQTTDYIESPDALCYYRDKLFIGHIVATSLENFVTVVRLL